MLPTMGEKAMSELNGDMLIGELKDVGERRIGVAPGVLDGVMPPAPNAVS